jgi:hypothetical protein
VKDNRAGSTPGAARRNGRNFDRQARKNEQWAHFVVFLGMRHSAQRNASNNDSNAIDTKSTKTQQ